MPDRPSTRAYVLAVLLAGTVILRPALAAAQERQQPQARISKAALTLTSDLAVLVVDVDDAVQLAQGVRTVITRQVPNVDIVVDSNGSRLRIAASATKGANVPLFVIDGVPLAEGYGLTIRARSLERIDVFRDAASTAPYGQRGSNGVVLIATTPRP